MTEKWLKAQKWERKWHGNCINSLNEEQKQLVYAEKMGITRSPTPKTPFNFDLKGKSILDIGGGAYSLLLKCVNLGNCFVVDPLMKKYPSWVINRYMEMDIVAFKGKGETLKNNPKIEILFDEIWIYNVLEHVVKPKKVIENALEFGKIVRIFEWLNTRSNIGHPHTLTKKELDKWLGGEGKVENVSRGGAVGTAYYGVFKGKHYE